MEHKASRDPRTVCFVPGLGITYSAYEKSLETLYSTGRSFFACAYIEAGLPIPPLAKEWIDTGFAKGEHVQRALGLIAALESVPRINRPVDVVAHSVGAIPAVLAAALRPDLFNALPLYAPAAFIGNDSPLRITQESGNIGTIMRNQLMQLQDNSKGEHARSFLSRANMSWSNYFRDHVFSLHTEIRDIASMNIAPLAHDLIQKGVKVSVELGENDALFSPNLLVPTLEKEGVPYTIHKGADHHSIGTEERIMQDLAKKLSSTS